MKSDLLRKAFLDFFKGKGHSVIETSPLIPIGDSSLLFTTAGMVQFKEQFASNNPSLLEYQRAASCQKCLRTSDLDIVGKTIRHHTFFEMLGNFSFGDYFKKESIEFAWEFSVDTIKLDPKRIYVSIYLDDDEAYKIWTEHIGIKKDRVIRLGKKDNFWGPAGDSGPCGPCSELYFDLGEDMLKEREGLSVGGDNDRYIEYWNLVFNQYNQLKSAKLDNLKFTGIDTGMGLERLTMISEGLKSVYETDIFKPVIEQIKKISPVPYNKDSRSSYNVIADHLRAISFLILENILPSNEGRGYVIRRILRRAIRFAHLIEIKEPFLYNLVDFVCDAMSIYPELKENKESVKKIIKAEEEGFLSTLEDANLYLDNLILKLKDKKQNTIPGKEAFKLYDSMGFPLSLVKEIAVENNMSVDTQTYDELMEEQRERARRNWKGDGNKLPDEIIEKRIKTEYEDSLSNSDVSNEARILYLLRPSPNLMEPVGKVSIPSNANEDKIVVITDRTIFYGEAGGQIGDIGQMAKEDALIEIVDTQKINDITLHYGIVREGTFSIGDGVNLSVDTQRKKAISRNHSATHLLQKALKDILGKHVKQLGSLVSYDKLRFDFSHFNALSKEEITQIEERVNSYILKNVNASIETMDQKEALSKGALAFFGDKYGSLVRTVKIDNSFELCGGTHVRRSGDIGAFKIISESSISSGTRRIEAITASKSLDLYYKLFSMSRDISLLLNTNEFGDFSVKIKELMEKNKLLEKKNKELNTKLSLSNIDELISKSLSKINGVNYIGLSLPDKETSELKKINDKIKTKYKNLITLLLSNKNGQVFYLASVSKELSSLYNANDIIKRVSSTLGGKGGGRDLIAQGRGTKPNKIDEALLSLREYISKN